MKIFLTGGSGFIGRNIIEQLGGTFEIIAPKHEELELTDSDAVYQFLEKNPVDLVIHAANIGGTRKQQHVFGITHTNLKIFFNIVRAKPFYKRLITLGSGAEYDKFYSLLSVKETDFGKHVPSDEYGLYKYVCAEYAAKVDYITHLRLFAVFGKYEDYEIRFISNAICRALLGKAVTMRQNVKYDYLFIDDFIRILDHIIKYQPKEKFINVGRGVAMDLKTIAEQVVREVGNNVEILTASKGWGNEYSCDVTRLQQEITNISYTPLDIAISKLIAYYRIALPKLKTELLVNE